MKLRNVLLCAALAIGSTLYAQIPVDRVDAYFPAPVEVNGVTLPAGNVSIQMVRNNGTMFLTLRSASGEHVNALVNRFEDVSSDVSEVKVILDQKDGVYHLEKISLPNHITLNVLHAQ
ncbi:MAG: hypothetical protein JST11_17570 [Acidobacteria bacterium]|nr:hypothetical protein [Acidobacteriota bacterium]